MPYEKLSPEYIAQADDSKADELIERIVRALRDAGFVVDDATRDQLSTWSS